MEAFLSRFSIQTKVILFLVPLLATIGGVGAIGHYSSGMLSSRLSVSSDILDALTGFKDTYADMTSFLRRTTADNKDAVAARLADQVAALDAVASAMTQKEDTSLLSSAREKTDRISGGIALLWQIYGSEQNLRSTIATNIDQLTAMEERIDTSIRALSKQANADKAPIDGLLNDAIASARAGSSADETLGELTALAGQLKLAQKTGKSLEAITKSVAKLQSSLHGVQLSATSFLGSATNENRLDLMKRFDTAQNDMQVLRAVGRGQETLEQVSGDLLQIMNGMEQDTKALIQVNAKRSEAFDGAGILVDRAWDDLRAFAEGQKVAADSQTSLANSISVTAMAIGALIALGAGFGLVWTLRRPIAAITQAMHQLAEGRIDTKVCGGERRDEIGAMARALAVFKSNAISKLTAEEEAFRTRQLADAERAANEEERQAVQDQIGEAVKVLGTALANLAAGDLSQRIERPFVGSLETLRMDFNSSVEKLNESLASIRQNAIAMQANSSQLSKASIELAHRTEQQACSLEETVATMGTIGRTVEASAAIAARADRAVEVTNRNANSSAQVVSDTVDAMRRIEAASSKINSIIEVIDDIAFQTNLLALNAGIEAARAGEAGKGFSVVAQEVRELSQRSAEAAQEIKSLIRGSAAEVHDGALLVEKTSSALSTIIDQVAAIRSDVASIAQATKDQWISVSEVNAALSQMDTITQRNAAMVEETNAASQVLAQECLRLRHSVEEFVIERSSPAIAA
ncbi:methyl-accepting chemotaxis protein [Rhizobium esperanzae]|uniref:Methyl-accepting chemotaxis protein n=1 Tax=Rhizobium esperanzae TaxID=1967781 RepID=A0A7W6R136_9HYPH|nr:HAMP domain-containing methyl-accepting chemotaxis protein [Rhizobium esperanzae]MBB4234737.1 methyl-accepting chemotaxis protein [Rhizobium esperanzae]